MHLAQLISVTEWHDVERSLVQYYPDACELTEGYRETFFHLRRLEPVATAMQLCVRRTSRRGLDHEPFLEVVGRNGTINRDLDDFKHLGKAEDSSYALSEAEFALDFVPWTEWLGMEIDVETLAKYPPSEIVAHCLWEMTFCGFDEAATDARRAEIQRRVDELNAMTEDEKKEKLISLDQVFKKFDARKEDRQ